MSATDIAAAAAPSGADTRAPPRPAGYLTALAAAAVVAAIVLSPLAALLGISFGGSLADWGHLVRHVIPGATLDTLAVLAMVAVGTASIGVTSAWLVVSYEFPLRRMLAWALVLPLAVPAYLAAYAYGEFLHYTGPVQTALRAAFGFQTIRDYWFPDIRSAPGLAVVLSAVLYPYVYLTTRVVFIMQGRNIADAARTLGATPAKVFRRVLLPVARPAIIAGVALVLMETLNDIGAAEYLGVRTLTFAVYTTWLGRGNLAGAAQIALVMLLIVFALLAAEQRARATRRFGASRAGQFFARPPRRPLTGWRAMAATLSGLLPILAGFGVPAYVFGRYVSRRLESFADPALVGALTNSVVTAAATAALTVGTALLLINGLRVSRARLVGGAVRLASIGYAVPGGILALGLLYVLAGVDNRVDGWMRASFGVSTGLLLTGSAAAVIIGCSIRFLALAEATVRSGLEKLPPNLDEAARSLGRSSGQSARAVLLPLLKPAIATAAVLVFVDTVKELSATILLRPFGFSTLATLVYENASRAAPAEGAAAAVLIIATALVPVLLLSRALANDRTADL